MRNDCSTCDAARCSDCTLETLSRWRQREDVAASERHQLYAKIVWHLIEEGIASVRETVERDGSREFRLDITVVTPHGWTPPAKVDDGKPIRVRR